MNFSLNDDQLALQKGIRDFCEQEFPLDKLGVLEKQPVTRERWRQLAEMGVFSLRLPEARGGVGLGLAETVIVFAELGRRLVPGPLVWSHLAAGAIGGAASGDAIVGGIDDTHPTNRPYVVEHASALDAFVVLWKTGVTRAPATDLAGRDIEVAPAQERARGTHMVESSRAAVKIGRNDPCPCGSGKKFKTCCLN